MDFLPAKELNDDQISFLIDHLAKTNDLEHVSNAFERFFKKNVSWMALKEIREEKADEISQAREKIYVDEINSLPIAHSFTTLSICQMRIEDLLKNLKTVRTLRKLTKDGKEYMEEVKEVDDPNIQKYLEISQKERFLTIKAHIETAAKGVDKQRIMPKSGSGIKPITVNTGFSSDGEEV